MRVVLIPASGFARVAPTDELEVKDAMDRKSLETRAKLLPKSLKLGTDTELESTPGGSLLVYPET